ncbi:MAG: DNA translocase FtsK 4TM domain-containing protein [Simkania sp.]|nr:DNA translocase FtsK 4TM domain-containing protein [Simkania sp.]
MSDKPKIKAHPEIKGLLNLTLTLFLFLSVLSFTHEVPSANWLGLVGYYVALSLLYTFGLGTYLIMGYLGWIGWRFLTTDQKPKLTVKTLYFSLLLLSVCLLLNLIAETSSVPFPFLQKRIFSEIYVNGYPAPHRIVRFNLGGVPLYYLYHDLPTFNLEHLLSNIGVFITFSITGLFSLILLTNTRVIPLFKKLLYFLKEAQVLLVKVIKDIKPSHKIPVLVAPEPIFEQPMQALPPMETLEEDLPEFEEEDDPSVKVTTLLDRKPNGNQGKPTKHNSYEGEYKRYRLPPINLLTNSKKVDQPTLKRDLTKQAGILEETLQSFGIEAKVGEINCGPTITSFEVHPPIGVKVQKIKVLENDIALNLQAKSIRIIAPIPGKAAVGVEIPSPYPQEVSFKEMLGEYIKGKKQHIPVLLGQTVTGDNIVTDLTKMPHCIIAGATGSGKSVCINSIVMSILMTARPDEVRLLLVDPKKVELSSYTNLPHMIAPVITEAHGAYAALNWLVKEMQHRYEILKHLGLRNIHSFNCRRPRFEIEQNAPFEIPRKMPFFVAIIDEFADLMMASSSDLETPIARIAQMARAVGIHLILATQRPSREVITGLIKANFPTRISFKVASRVNSQIILDENGAESLLGNGDLLFLPPGTSNLIRAQGVFIRDEDINRVIEHIEKQAHTQYLIKSFDQMAPEDMMGEGEEPKDDMYEQAYVIVTQTGTASTTFLQRKLKIGYARAASLMDELESRGVIGPQEGSRPRRVLQGTSKKDV